MSIAVLIAALIVALVVHEYAHYRAMRSDGIRITAAGLGLPFPPVLRIHWRGITWTLSPWLLGAYVQPHQADYQRMETSVPYRRLAWHYGAGITANFILGFAVLAVAHATNRVAFMVLGIVAAATWVFRREVAAYLQPALAPAATAVMVYGLARSWAHGHTGLGYAGIEKIAPASLTVSSVLDLVGLLSLGVGILNLLPLYPMDNGRTVNWLIRRWWGEKTSRRFQRAGMVLVLASLVGAVLSDGWAAVSAVI